MTPHTVDLAAATGPDAIQARSHRSDRTRATPAARQPDAGSDLSAAWPEIIRRLSTPEHTAGVRLFLASAKVRPTGLSDGVLAIDCPTAMFQEKIRERYGAMLIEAATAVLGQPVREIACRVTGAASREHESKVASVAAEIARGSDADGRPGRAWGHGFKLLDTFVVGSCNRLAYDAVMAILNRPESAVNPLFIHGASGLGKTHLEQGLAIAFKERHPRAKVQYIRCEQFTNDFIAACNQGPEAIRAFRVRMRHPDLLLIDDIHFLSQGLKVRTKDELFSTFDELTEQGKRVVITSDAKPRDIQYLEERFVQRFAGGLVVELLRPDPAVRREIIQSKARSQVVALPESVVDYVADHITDNIRELEGAVNKLVQFARSFDRKIDLDLARQALADVVERAASESVETMVLREVAKHFEIEVADLTGGSRAGGRSAARHVAMYVLKSASSRTYSEIGRALGVKSHASVAHACEQVARRRAATPALDAFIDDLVLRTRRT